MRVPVLLVAPLLLSTIFSAPTLAFQKGPNDAATKTDVTGIGSQAWTLGGTPHVDLSAAPSNGSHFLQATGFGFSLAADATVTGIAVRLDKAINVTSGPITVTDAAVRIVKGGVIGTTDRSDASAWPTGSSSVVLYGGLGDMWGETWSPSDINSPGFGVAVAATALGPGSATAFVFIVRITVFYSGCPTSPEPCSITSQKGVLVADEQRVGHEKLVIKMLKGPTSQLNAFFGNPLSTGGTFYDMCIYNGGGALVGHLRVDRAGETTCAGNACWSPVGPPPPNPATKGYRFSDPDMSSDGVQMLLMNQTSTFSKVIAKAKNTTGSLPLGIAAGLSGSTSATVQFLGSDAELGCRALQVTEVLHDEPLRFQARRP